MRAMPSPTSSTRPISSTSVVLPYWSISLRRTETISSGLNFMTATLNQLIADGVQLVLHAGVVAPVADLHDESAQQVGVDTRAQDGFFLRHLAQLADQALALVVRERHGAAHQNTHLVGALLDQGGIDVEDRPQQLQPLVFVDHEQEVEEQRRHLALERLPQGHGPAIPANQAAQEELADGRVRPGDAAEQ